MTTFITIDKSTSNEHYHGNTVSLSLKDVELISRVSSIPGYKVEITIVHKLIKDGYCISEDCLKFRPEHLQTLKLANKDGSKFYIWYVNY